jgi:hypothetical protein
MADAFAIPQRSAAHSCSAVGTSTQLSIATADRLDSILGRSGTCGNSDRRPPHGSKCDELLAGTPSHYRCMGVLPRYKHSTSHYRLKRHEDLATRTRYPRSRDALGIYGSSCMAQSLRCKLTPIPLRDLHSQAQRIQYNGKSGQ